MNRIQRTPPQNALLLQAGLHPIRSHWRLVVKTPLMFYVAATDVSQTTRCAFSLEGQSVELGICYGQSSGGPMRLDLTRSAIAAISVITGFGFAAQPVHAQSYYGGYAGGPVEVIQGHIMGGYSPTSGVTSDFLQDGWIIDGGFTFWPQGVPLGIRTDLSYSGHQATNQFLALGQAATGLEVDDGSGSFSSLAAGLVFRPRQYGLARFYGLAQAGATRVREQLTQTFFVAGSYCDPFFYYCGYQYGTGDAIVYDYATTKFSWNVGLGVEFPTYWGSSWFLEAQYRRVETQQPLEYWPIMVGIRF